MFWSDLAAFFGKQFCYSFTIALGYHKYREYIGLEFRRSRAYIVEGKYYVDKVSASVELLFGHQ